MASDSTTEIKIKREEENEKKDNRVHLPPFKVDKVKMSAMLQELSNWAFRCFRIKELWEHTKGKEVKVAVLNTSATHKDIKVKKFVNFFDDEDEDKCGHGTWVSG